MGQAEEYAEEKPSITFENIQWSAILNYYFSKALVYKSFGKLTFRNNRFRHGTNRVLGGLDLENIPSLNELVWDRNEIENSDFLEGMFGSLIEARRGLTSITNYSFIKLRKQRHRHKSFANDPRCVYLQHQLDKN